MDKVDTLVNFPSTTALQVFLTVVDDDGVSRAGVTLGLSQPSVSQHLRTLEQHFGQPLLVKRGRKLTLTPFGEQVLPEIRRAVQALHQLHSSVRAVGNSERGHIEMGASTTMLVYILPKFIAAFRQAHPGVTLNVHSGRSERLTRRLLQGELEFAIVEGMQQIPGFQRTLFFEDELVVLVRPDHPWAQREDVPFEWLTRVPVITRERTSVTWTVLSRAFEQRNLSLNPVIYVDNHEVTKRLVLEGAGVGIVSRVVVQPNVRLGLLKTLRMGSESTELRRLFHLFQPEHLSNPATTEFIRLLLG